VTELARDRLRSLLKAALQDPTAPVLWELQKTLLVHGGRDGERAREVARQFDSCLRTLETKAASRTASRWGAVLGTAAVGSVSLPELRKRQVRGLGDLLELALPAVLEVGAALQSAAAWEIEAGRLYDNFAWFLYDELWDISLGARPELTPDERREQIDEVIDPLMEPDLADSDRATLVVEVFRSLLAARVMPLLG
jgi:hypothetical protein